MKLKELLPVYQKQGEGIVYKHRFTVFTPVFNCENTISKVHQSLLKQTFKDFEWLIINDGSTDKSHEVIHKIIETSPLKIQYVNNEKNQHKMGCFIQSIGLAKGEFLLTFDGDDECVPEALSTFDNEYNTIPEEMKPKVGAVTVLCIDQNNELIGKHFPKSPYYCNTFKAKMLKEISGEKWGFTKTDILKGMKVNPSIFNSGLIPESLIWNLVAKEGYLTKCVNIKLRIYHTDVEDSLSSSSMASTAFGTSLISISQLNWFLKDFFFTSPIFFLKSCYFLLRSSNYQDRTAKDYISSIDSFWAKSTIGILWPFRKLMR